MTPFSLPGKLVLAPMEAVNCASFRVLCQELGCDVLYTQMLDADEVVDYAKQHGAEQARKHFVNRRKEERYLAVQIGGGNVDNLVKTIALVKQDANSIDLNLGCPLGSMCGKKGGAYLLKHPERLDVIIPQLIAACGAVPFTCKIRLGWDDNNGVALAQRLERLGVASLAVHGRTRQQRYTAKADWYAIRRIKLAVQIPVIANGDVSKPHHVITALGQTKADAVMIGREAMDNPLIFQAAKQLLDDRTAQPHITCAQQYTVIKRWLALYKQHESRNSLNEMQDHVCWMTKGWPNANKLRDIIRTQQSEKDIRSVLGMWAKNLSADVAEHSVPVPEQLVQG